MKLLKFGPIGAEKAGILDDQGQIRDASSLVTDWTPQTWGQAQSIDIKSLPIVQPARLGAPISGIGNILCIGLNYADHAAEQGAKLPIEPIIFSKHTSSLCGPNDPIIIPRGSDKTDWEVELAVVIGKKAQYVSPQEAMNYVAGYTLINDVSERAFQKERAGQWIKGKSAENFAPIGPYFVTKDEIPDPHNLPLWLKLNNEFQQNGSTKDMIFKINELVSYISNFMTLLPGDLIATGTPAGVGMGKDLYLKAGDKVELGAESLGIQQHEVVLAK